MALQKRKPGVALINNSQTPYRLALHLRIAREMPELKLWSVFTHEAGSADWDISTSPEIGPVLFGKGESSNTHSQFRYAAREWTKGGRIIRWIRENDIRAIVIGGYNDVGRLRIIRWCRKSKISCFLFGDSNIRGDNAAGFKAVLKKAVVTWVLGRCTGVFACGELGKQYFMKYGAAPNRCYFFPYEPDYEMIRQLPVSKIDEARQRFNLHPERRRIVYSGRLVTQKRVDLLIDAFSKIAPQRPEWDLIIAGDGGLRDELTARVPAEIRDRVRWLGFIDDQNVLSAVYRLSDVLVLPSDYEPWAVVINEAVAAGMAVVASDVVGAAQELVVDRFNGRICKTGEESSLVECLFDVTNETNLARMKQNSGAALEAWRRRGDPVAGLRRALLDFGLLSSSADDKMTGGV